MDVLGLLGWRFSFVFMGVVVLMMGILWVHNKDDIR